MRAAFFLFDRLVLAVMAVLAVVWIAPVAWVVALSLRPSARNFTEVWNATPLPDWMLHSTVVAAWQTVLTLTIASLAGYGFARTDFPGKGFLYGLVLVALAVPEAAVIVPLHILFSAADLHNSYLGLILPRLGWPFGVLLMTQYFRAISPEIEEAALLDNASRFLVFWRVVLPLSVPALAALGIYTFVNAWNDFFWPLVSATDPDIYTVTVGLASLLLGGKEPAIGLVMAQAIVAAAPMVLLYLFFQRYLIAAVAEWAAD